MNDHAKMCSRTDKREDMEDVFTNRWTNKDALFVNRQTCQAYQHTSKEQRMNATSSKPMTIKDSMNFAMRR